MYIGKNAPGSHKEDLEREQQEVIRGEHLSASILSDFLFKIHASNLPSYSNVGSGVSVAKLIYWYPHQSKLPLNWTKQNHCCGEETILQNKIPYFILDQKSFKSKFDEKSAEVEVDTLQTPSGEDITLILKFHSSFHHQRTFNLYWKGSVSLKSFQFNPKPI